MKKFLALILSVFTAISLISCTKVEVQGDESYTIGVVDGAPALAVANIANGYTYEDTSYKIETAVQVASQPQNIVAGLVNGDLDMAIIPLNLGSKLYNESKSLNLKLASVNIFGCLYMIGKNDIESLNDLKGKVVYTVGENGTPEIIFNYLLTQLGISYEYGDEVTDTEKVYVKIAQAQEIMVGFKQNTIDYAILGEPVVSKINGNTGTHVVLDLQEEWKKYFPDGKFVQAGLVVNGEVAKKSGFINSLLDKLSQNEQFAIENIESLKDIYTELGSSALVMNFSEDIIDRCNIGCSKASIEKANVEAFLTAVKNFKAPLIGGQLPGEDFYL